MCPWLLDMTTLYVLMRLLMSLTVDVDDVDAGKRVNDSLDTCFGTLIVSFGQLLDQVLKIYNFPLL